MYTLKSIVRRGTPMAAIFAIVAATVLPSAAVFADALNPLTERSLLLSSSAPGYVDTDGSGNSEGQLNANGEEYAPPGSGPNGTKTGETFSFKVSTDSSTTNAIKAFTLQYCNEAAGLCQAPGNNTGDNRTPDRESNATAKPNNRSDLDVVGSWTQAASGTDPAAGQFQIYVNGAASTNTWTMAATNKEDNAYAGALTGKNNYITLASSTGETPSGNQEIKIVFKASTNNYITNPGDGKFFVKMNTYNDQAATTVLDGGVTVANMMTDSIHITTKVLETMSFSVGTRNRDTVVVDCAPADPLGTGCGGSGAIHPTCEPIQVISGNRLDLGNPNAENSLETDKAYDAYSYWRLSSNSSGGATVYYSGDTLRNTVGDHIAPVGTTETLSTPGTEQFGLSFVDAGTDTFDPILDDGAGGGLFHTDPRYSTPHIAPLVENTSYDEGTGIVGDSNTPATAKFAFDVNSQTVPAVIATESTDVLPCSTAKMRYVGNIAADTPAGVYTTKINYLAAPQY